MVGEREATQVQDECSTLILPALSIGNVGQLATDLLISTLRAERVEYLDDPYVLPCVGNDPYESIPRGNLVLPLEAYALPKSLTIVQQRSPVVKGRMVQFAKNMADYALANGKNKVIVLSGLDFSRWQHIDTSSGTRVFYLSSANFNGTNERCEQLGWTKLESYDPSQRGWKLLFSLIEGSSSLEDLLREEDVSGDDFCYPRLPFAALFGSFKAKGLDVTCVMCYCSEGDNRSDAFLLASATCKYLEHTTNNFNWCQKDKWIIPSSWNTVYGPPPNISIF